MARTTINSLGIPADTIVSADLDYPLTDFSSTGIDDNASSTSLTIDSSGNISVTGTVDGRDLATDGTKLDGIAASATNYGDSDVATYISGNRSYGNISVTGYIAGPSTFTIDPAAVGDNTGTLVVAGNLQVDGTTTTINSTTMTVDDLNITLASGAANAAAANGAGITVDGASATLTYNSTPDAWSFNKNVGIGTTSPAAELHINNSSGATFTRISGTTAAVLDMYGGASNTKPIRFFGGSDTEAYAGIRALSNNLGLSFETGIGGSTAATERMRIDSNGKIFMNEGVPFSWTDSSQNVAAEIYGDSSDNLVFRNTSAKIERMRIASNGNVGIGNSNPYTKLHVKKDSDTDYTPIRFVSTEPTVLITNTTSGALNYASLAFTTESNGEFGIGAVQNSGNSASDFVFVSRDSGSRAERARITSNGNVGIGTDSPGRKLHLKDGQIKFQNTGSGSWAGLDFSMGNGTYDGYMGMLDSDGKFFIDVDSNGNDFVILQNGNVGIGTDSPSYKLDVDVGAPASNDQLLGRFSSQAGTRSIAFVWDDSASTLGIGTQTNHALAFHINGSSAEKMRIDTSGNVGIGTAGPSYKFHVQTGTTGAIAKFEGSSGRYLYTGTDGNGQYVEAVGTTGAERVLRLQASNGSGTYTQLFIDGGNGYISTSSTAHFYAGGYSYQNSTGHALYKEGNHHLSINTNSYGSEVILLNNLTTSGVCSFLQYRTNGSAHGSLYAATNGLTIQNSSDYRIKNNVNNLTGALDIIKDLRPVKFTLYDETEIRTGFIAHEVDETIPDTDMVYGEKDAVDENGDIVCQTLGMGTNMFAYLVGAIKEQQSIIDSLQTRIEALESA